ncbi:arabinose transporter permease [Paenibacillus durus ATCC 35681]|uniref:Arabinose transporter permease n=2 Tax=Paenibacillus durus TaxID=44251 RepID=A0A0F7CKN8_PAEDU|nr:arabinose transporter permease [Paenibacillus durus ATCC 35681]
MPIALWALTLASFGIGTTELVPMGLLPTIAEDLKVSLFAAGLLITGYALGVVIGVPFVSVIFSRISRKNLLLLLVGGFAIGNLLCAWAPNYTFLMIARVICAFMHGTFFGESYVVAAKLAPSGKQTSALALVSLGLTLSTVLGAPLGTYLGLAYNWRMPFYVIAGIGVIAFMAIALLLPGVKQEQVASLRKQFGVLRRPQVLLALMMTVFGIGGVFTVLTYITPMLEQITGVSSHGVSAILLIYGIGTLVGNIVGAKLADRWLLPTLLGALIVLAVVLTSLTFTIHNPIAAIITIFIWGGSAFASIPPLQMHILEKASDAPQFASGLNVAAFNMGNALGAFLGGIVIENPSLHLSALPWVAALVTFVGVFLTLVSLRID